MKIRKGVLLRKIVHIILSIPLLLPIIVPEAGKILPPGAYYAIATIVTCLGYAAYVKREILNQIFNTYAESIRQILSKSLISIQSFQTNTAIINHVRQAFLKIENHLKELVELAERDYERRYSFVGILMGCVGVLCSYVLFNKYVMYGILTLIVYDSISGLVGSHVGRLKIPGSIVTIEGAAAGAIALFIVLVTIFKISLIAAAIIALSAIIAEAYGIEDNFTLPVITSMTAFILAHASLLY